MQSEVFCISAAMTVGRAQTSHLAMPSSLHSHHPPHVCPVLQVLKTGIWVLQQMTDIWLSRGTSKEERDLSFSLDLVVLRPFTASRSTRCEGVFGWFYYCIKLTANPEQRQSMPRYPWEHLSTKQEPWSLQPHPGDTSLTSEKALHEKCKGNSSTHRGQHYKTQSSIKSASEALQQVYSTRHSRSFISKSFPENRRSQLPATSTTRLQMAAIQVLPGCRQHYCTPAMRMWVLT